LFLGSDFFAFSFFFHSALSLIRSNSLKNFHILINCNHQSRVFAPNCFATKASFLAATFSLPSPAFPPLVFHRTNSSKRTPCKKIAMSDPQPPSAFEICLQSLRASPAPATDLNLKAAKELQEELSKYIAAGASSSASSTTEKRARPCLRLGVLGSTRGTALQAVLDAISGGSLDAKVEVIVSNISSAGILERAKQHHIEGVHIAGKGKSRDDYDTEVRFVCRGKGRGRRNARKVITGTGTHTQPVVVLFFLRDEFDISLYACMFCSGVCVLVLGIQSAARE
jgi:hypothetical protein